MDFREMESLGLLEPRCQWTKVEEQCAPHPSKLRYHTEILISRELCVPDQKPSIEKIISVKHEASICRVTPIPVRLTNGCIAGLKFLIEGKLRLGVEYSALVPEQDVHFAHFDLSFDGMIVDGVCQKPIPIHRCDTLDYHVHIYIEHVQAYRQSERCLRAVVVLLVWIEFSHHHKHRDDWDYDDKCDKWDCDAVARMVSKQIAINPCLPLPEQKPCVEELLSHDVELTLVESKIINTPLEVCGLPIRKVIIIGEAVLIIKYVADAPDQPVHAAHYVIPFDALIEWPGGPPVDTPLQVCLTVEYSHVDQCGKRGFVPIIIIRIDVSLA